MQELRGKIGTNPDVTGPTERGVMPAAGSLIAPIEIATGKKAYFVGKPQSVDAASQTENDRLSQ